MASAGKVEDVAIETERVQEIAIAEIGIHKLNPRKTIGDVTDLAASIKAEGVIQPILVVRDNGGYAAVHGSRRLAAAKLAGFESIPAIVRDLSEADIAAAALVENLQRMDLDPLEEAQGYRSWLQLTKKTQVELAKAVGRAPSTIANALRLLDSAKPIQEALREKRITPAHARVALELKDPSYISSLKLDEKTSVDDLKERVDEANEEWATTGAGAFARAIKELVAAREKYPNATVTWKKAPSFRRDVVDLVKALGKPPATVLSGIGEHQTLSVALHDKNCSCQAIELGVQQDWNHQGRLVFTTERVCIDRKGFHAAVAAKPKPRPVAHSSTPRKKKPTADQLAKREVQARKEAEREVTKALLPPKPQKAAAAPIYAKLRKGTIPSDTARAIAFLELVEYGRLGSQGEVVAWERIAKMPAKKIHTLAAAAIAQRLERDVMSTRRYSAIKGDSDPEAAYRLVTAYFGVKVAEPKATKKAKR